MERTRYETPLMWSAIRRKCVAPRLQPCYRTVIEFLIKFSGGMDTERKKGGKWTKYFSRALKNSRAKRNERGFACSVIERIQYIDDVWKECFLLEYHFSFQARRAINAPSYEQRKKKAFVFIQIHLTARARRRNVHIAKKKNSLNTGEKNRNGTFVGASYITLSRAKSGYSIPNSFYHFCIHNVYNIESHYFIHRRTRMQALILSKRNFPSRRKLLLRK